MNFATKFLWNLVSHCLATFKKKVDANYFLFVLQAEKRAHHNALERKRRDVSIKVESPDDSRSSDFIFIFFVTSSSTLKTVSPPSVTASRRFKVKR